MDSIFWRILGLDIKWILFIIFIVFPTILAIVFRWSAKLDREQARREQYEFDKKMRERDE